IVRLMELARAANIPIFYTSAAKRPDLMDAGVVVNKNSRGREATTQVGTHATTVIAELTPRPQDFMIIKPKASAFFGSPFMSQLNQLDIDTLIVTGCTTSGCVRAT